MRILHVLHSHGYGGAENHALVLMQALKARGHEVRFAGPSDSWLARHCEQSGIQCHDLAMHGMYDLVSVFKLRRLVARWRPDLVHGHLVRGAHYAGLAVLNTGGRGPALCTAHATTARKHMGLCRHIIAVSEAVRENLLRHGQPPQRVSMVYNGVPDVPHAPGLDRAALRQELGIPDAAFALVNAGRFVPDKGQDVLVRALKSCSDDVRLCLIGDAETGFGREVRGLAGGDPRVLFLGYRPDVPRLLTAFDAYVLGSRREALGLSLVEAAAAGLPAVASSVGGVPEVVLDARSGWLVPADDPQALAARIQQLRDAGPDVRARMGAAGRAHYLQHFTMDRMVDGTLSVYLNVIGARP